MLTTVTNCLNANPAHTREVTPARAGAGDGDGRVSMSDRTVIVTDYAVLVSDDAARARGVTAEPSPELY